MVSLSPGIPWAQTADAAHLEVDFHAGLCGRIERLDTGFVDQRVHLERQVAVTVLALTLGLAGNTHQELLAHGHRSNEQFAVGLLAGIAGEGIEQVGDIGTQTLDHR